MPRLCGVRTSGDSLELGVIASMQPSHASDDMRWADARLGPGRVDGAYAWRWFADAGVTLAHGSDFPVEIVNPFWGIYAGVTRQDAAGKPTGGWHPEQRLTLEETLRGFTAGGSLCGIRRRSRGDPQGGIAGGPHDRRSRFVPGVAQRTAWLSGFDDDSRRCGGLRRRKPLNEARFQNPSLPLKGSSSDLDSGILESEILDSVTKYSSTHGGRRHLHFGSTS